MSFGNTGVHPPLALPSYPWSSHGGGGVCCLLFKKKLVEKVNEIARRDEGLESMVNIGVIGLVL